LQGFPVSLVAAAFNSAGAIIVVIGLSVSAVFFAYQPVEVVVLIGGGAVGGVFADQAADGIAFETVYLIQLNQIGLVIFYFTK
jgi:hypothetical protein